MAEGRDGKKGFCNYAHHENCGKPITCEKCGGPMTCGPFMHECRNCSPRWFQDCRICRAPRIFCCC